MGKHLWPDSQADTISAVGAFRLRRIIAIPPDPSMLGIPGSAVERVLVLKWFRIELGKTESVKQSSPAFPFVRIHKPP
jgi:hypothetical protein